MGEGGYFHFNPYLNLKAEQASNHLQALFSIDITYSMYADGVRIVEALIMNLNVKNIVSRS
jgi:hypothetical protein